MALTVEDGSGLAAADALASLDFVDEYHADRGNTGWTGQQSAREAAIRRASTVLSNSYTWRGLRRRGREQALAWPRYDVIDAEDWTVPADAVPIEIQQATAEIALRELVAPGSMTPDVVAGTAIKRQRKKVGELETEVEYLHASTGASASVPVLTIVKDLIGGLLASGAGSALVGRAVRA